MQGRDLEAQVRVELEQIMPIVSTLTGLPARWSGRVELVENVGFLGQKRFSCDILIRKSLAGQPDRWPTLIHEALHAASTGYVRRDFLELPGWEEGVVEHLQRLFRPAILSHLGVLVSEAIFKTRESNHAYNPYIKMLEKIRAALPVSEVQFYQQLLATPIAGRPASIFKQIRSLPGETQRDALTIYSAASATLRTHL